MNRRIIITFIVSTLLSFLVFQFVFDRLIKNREDHDQRQSQIIQDNVKQRFDLFLDIPLAIGQISSRYLAIDQRLQETYGAAAKKILDDNSAILGLNLLDSNGKIIKIYPLESNQGAIGKVTQNYQSIMNSFNRGEDYWFSPPFDLFQAKRGFAFYTPITIEGKLQGWFATVMTVEKFFEAFRGSEFLRSYHLNIKDKATGAMYFETALEPTTELKIYRSEVVLNGRDIEFLSWRKEPLAFYLHWNWSVLLSFIIGLGCSYTMKVVLLKKKTTEEIKNINTILNLTAKEALSHLIDMHSELNLMGSSGYIRTEVIDRDINYITNLIEQIELLETISGQKDFDTSTIHCLPILDEQIGHLRDSLDKRKLNLCFDRKKISILKIHGNGWLFGNSVLRNLLTQAIIIAEPGSELDLDCEGDADSHYIKFHVKKLQDPNFDIKTVSNNRRLEVVQKALPLFGGKLLLQDDLSGGLLMKVFLTPS